jgi:uncharacterized membrane protein
MINVLAVPHFRLGVGGPLVQAPLLVHVGAGVVAIVAGYVALFTVKGAEVHRKSGLVFVYAMVTMGLVASTLAAFERNTGSVVGGLLAAYFVITALTAVRPATVASRRAEFAGMLLALAVGSMNVALGLDSAVRGAATRRGVPVPMYFFLGTIALLAGLSDIRVLRRGGLRGAARLVRHLWRMCFAAFIATGSFFLGQQKVIPASLRGSPILFALAFAPFALMAFWLVRVRLGRWTRPAVPLSGTGLAEAVSPPSPACRP